MGWETPRSSKPPSKQRIMSCIASTRWAQSTFNGSDSEAFVAALQEPLRVIVSELCTKNNAKLTLPPDRVIRLVSSEAGGVVLADGATKKKLQLVSCISRCHRMYEKITNNKLSRVTNPQRFCPWRNHQSIPESRDRCYIGPFVRMISIRAYWFLHETLFHLIWCIPPWPRIKYSYN